MDLLGPTEPRDRKARKDRPEPHDRTAPPDRRMLPERTEPQDRTAPPEPRDRRAVPGSRALLDR